MVILIMVTFSHFDFCSVKRVQKDIFPVIRFSVARRGVFLLTSTPDDRVRFGSKFVCPSSRFGFGFRHTRLTRLKRNGWLLFYIFSYLWLAVIAFQII